MCFAQPSLPVDQEHFEIVLASDSTQINAISAFLFVTSARYVSKYLLIGLAARKGSKMKQETLPSRTTRCHTYRFYFDDMLP